MDHILWETHIAFLATLFRSTKPRPRPIAISPPDRGRTKDEQWRYFESSGAIYKLFWTGIRPSLDDFPHNLDIKRIAIPPNEAATWRQSSQIHFGADSSIREDRKHPPILKLAHPDSTCRARISHEFNMLQEMAKHALPVPAVCPQPLVSGANSIYGYRMERLYPLDLNHPSQYKDAVEEGVRRVHNAGFSLGDLHPGNVMFTEDRRLVFIDMSYAGRLGEQIPSYVPDYAYKQPVFHVEADYARLHQFFA